jgi:hypothetical protein
MRGVGAENGRDGEELSCAEKYWGTPRKYACTFTLLVMAASQFDHADALVYLRFTRFVGLLSVGKTGYCNPLCLIAHVELKICCSLTPLGSNWRIPRHN